MALSGHGRLRNVEEFDPEEPGALGPSEQSVRAIAGEIVREVLTPTERVVYYANQRRHGH